MSPWLLSLLANYKRASRSGARPGRSFEISVTKWLQVAKTLSMSCQIFTSIPFPTLKNIQEDLPKSRKVLLKNSLRGKKMKTLKKDLLGLKISQKVSGRKAPRNQINREDSSNCIRQLLEPVCFSYKDQGWKRL